MEFDAFFGREQFPFGIPALRYKRKKGRAWAYIKSTKNAF